MSWYEQLEALKFDKHIFFIYLTELSSEIFLKNKTLLQIQKIVILITNYSLFKIFKK